ncbi:hypothetical protein TYRP_019696 [Tyrophagus putrescentiae]|nr:hypothetical protein TYRP_019696 [Tyrophagus putrescentiae]
MKFSSVDQSHSNTISNTREFAVFWGSSGHVCATLLTRS